eukprot:52341-Eustigmatos_ZCMA.PRE.1
MRSCSEATINVPTPYSNLRRSRWNCFFHWTRPSHLSRTPAYGACVAHVDTGWLKSTFLSHLMRAPPSGLSL